jgi:hypothetical protein
MNTSSESKSTSIPVAVPKAGSAVMVAATIIGSLFTFLFHFGAARLSYLKYQSVAWAILDFFFAVFYYPYYALFLAEAAPAVGMFGGAKVVKGLLKMLR